MNGRVGWLQRARLEELLWRSVSVEGLDADEMPELSRLSLDRCPDLLDELRVEALGLVGDEV